MPTVPEFVVLVLVVVVVFGIHKMSDISSAVARWRLQYDEDIPDDAIEVVSSNRDHETEDQSETDSSPSPGTS